MSSLPLRQIRYEPTGRIEVSAQNHNYAVEVATLPKEVEITHININDGTCAGMVRGALRSQREFRGAQSRSAACS